MPVYEYISRNKNKACSLCKSKFEITQSILDQPLELCPECGNQIEKCISLTGAFITIGKEANQYSDCRYAKYWRDKNGVRHRVTAADGNSSSPTVSRRQTASPELIEARK